MDNFEKLIGELKKMDKSQRNSLLDKLNASMNDSQRKKLGSLLSDKKGKKELEEKMRDVDMTSLLSGISSADDLGKLLTRDDLREKLKSILG